MFITLPKAPMAAVDFAPAVAWFVRQNREGD
jgi:hypothetical protein